MLVNNCLLFFLRELPFVNCCLIGFSDANCSEMAQIVLWYLHLLVCVYVWPKIKILRFYFYHTYLWTMEHFCFHTPTSTLILLPKKSKCIYTFAAY